MPLRVRDLSAHLIELLLSKLPVINRLAAQRVCKRWRDILHAPAAWSTLDLRGVPGCCVTGRVASKVLRDAALALPAAAPGEAAAAGLAQPASLLRRLRIETSSNGPASATNFAAIGRHPSMATVEELAIVALNGSDIVVSTGFMRELDLAQLSFPSLKLLCVESLHVEIFTPGYDFFPDRTTESHEPFLAACDRVAGLLRRRPVSAAGLVRLFFPAPDYESIDVYYPVDVIGDDMRPLLAGLCDVLEAVAGHVLPRSPFEQRDLHHVRGPADTRDQ